MSGKKTINFNDYICLMESTETRKSLAKKVGITAISLRSLKKGDNRKDWFDTYSKMSKSEIKSIVDNHIIVRVKRQKPTARTNRPGSIIRGPANKTKESEPIVDLKKYHACLPLSRLPEYFGYVAENST